MPIYEYECNNGHEFEELQSFSDAPKKKCPVCGSRANRRISLSAFVLKGSGWYSKDTSSASASKADADKPEESADKIKTDVTDGKDAKKDATAGSTEKSDPVKATPPEKKAKDIPRISTSSRKPAPKKKAAAGRRR